MYQATYAFTLMFRGNHRMFSNTYSRFVHDLVKRKRERRNVAGMSGISRLQLFAGIDLSI